MSQDSQIKKLTDLVQRLVDNPVAPVQPVAPVLPLAPVSTIDHDLQIKLIEKVDQIQIDVNFLKSQGDKYINQTDHKIVCDSINDHEVRIRSLNDKTTQIMTWGAALLLVLGIVEVTLRFIIK